MILLVLCTFIFNSIIAKFATHLLCTLCVTKNIPDNQGFPEKFVAVTITKSDFSCKDKTNARFSQIHSHNARIFKRSNQFKAKINVFQYEFKFIK